MSSNDRRAAARRRAWGRGPIILRFESLEDRQLLTAGAVPDLVGSSFETQHTLAWGSTFEVKGTILNQGRGTANQPFTAGIYASTSPYIGPNSVQLGTISVPAGLAPDQTSTFDQSFTLPSTPIAGFTGKPIFIGMMVDPHREIQESNNHNNFGVGRGRDTSAVTIVPLQPSKLVGSSLGVNTTQLTWGQPLTVTAQVRNNAQGDAPESRVRLVLTPAGTSAGTLSDVTIGFLNLPAVPAWQTVNAVGTFTLPTTIPNPLVGTTQYTLSMIQDSTFVTNPVYPHAPTQGVGLDSTPITITSAPDTIDPTKIAKADLAAGIVTAPSTTLSWGQDFPVSTTIENLGQVNAGPFNVDFILSGASDAYGHGIFLGEASLPGLQAGFSQTVTQTVHLPSRLPSGVTVNGFTLAKISVIVDPDNYVNETFKSNNIANSKPVTLRLLGTDGTVSVPTTPAVAFTPGTPSPVGTLSPTSGRTPLPAQPGGRKLHRAAPPPKHSLTSKIEHTLKVFPSNVNHAIKQLFNVSQDKPPKKKK